MIDLVDRGIVRVSGQDATAFLQTLLTNDVLGLAQGSATYAALLNPQGKILFDFLVYRNQEGFWLDCPLGMAGDLARRLGFYRLRAKVDVTDVSANFGIIASQSDPGLAEAYRDPRHPALGYRAIVPRADLTGRGDPAAYDAHRIAVGVPSGGVDFFYGDTFVHEANLDRLNGVDFRKGCYVGQEVVSRVEHRGLARKRLVQLNFDGPSPVAGSHVMAGEVLLGVMGSAAAGNGLALLRLDRLAEAGETPVLAGGTRVRITEA